jgi:Na+/H+-dicarboxylate symporter
MSEMSEPKKGNRLTMYIIVALIAGIGLGFSLNSGYVKQENALISSTESALNHIRHEVNASKDTAAGTYKTLLKQSKALSAMEKNNIEIRDKKLEPFSLMGDLFLRLIKMIIAPLVFSTLVVGVAKLGDIKSVGRIGAKTLGWFLAASCLSLLLGMALVNIFKPGEAMHLPVPDMLDAGISKSAFTLKEFLYHVFPTSIIDAMARNEILQIVVFAILFGVATAAIGEKGNIVIKAMDAVSHVILKMTGYIMKLAPIAVFGAMTAVIARQGLGILQTYSIFIGEFYFGLFLLWILLFLAGAVLKRTYLH